MKQQSIEQGRDRETGQRRPLWSVFIKLQKVRLLNVYLLIVSRFVWFMILLWPLAKQVSNNWTVGKLCVYCSQLVGMINRDICSVGHAYTLVPALESITAECQILLWSPFSRAKKKWNAIYNQTFRITTARVISWLDYVQWLTKSLTSNEEVERGTVKIPTLVFFFSR